MTSGSKKEQGFPNRRHIIVRDTHSLTIRVKVEAAG
jgi:hypothetical protein